MSKPQQPAASTTPGTDETAGGFTAEERDAMQERVRELKSARHGAASGKGDGERDLFAKIAEMAEPDRSMAERVHAIVMASAPELAPKTWYGMPAYANRDGKVICFFQAASKFKVRYATFGFQPDANLDEGAMWPTSFALVELTPDVEARIAALVEQAAS
jgi:uncharacterized protein YdhG (YjbR/CyaY superfamily)